MKPHIGNYKPTSYEVSREACHPKWMKHRRLTHQPVWMCRTMNKHACRLSLCYSKTQSDNTDSPFGNMTAHQWQTRNSLKQIAGLLHKMKKHSPHLHAHMREKERKCLSQRSPLSKPDKNEDYSNADQGEMRFSNTAKGEIQTGCISEPQCKLYLGVFFREAKPTSSLICKYTEVIFSSEQLQGGANNPLHLLTPGSEVADNESLLAAFLATQIHLSLTADCGSFSSTNAWRMS